MNPNLSVNKPKVYYEYYRSGKKGYDATSGDIEYPAHFHHNLEVCVMRSGERDMCIGGKQIHAKAPCVAVVDSFVVHSYGKGDGEHCVIVIPYDMLYEFNQIRRGKNFAEDYIQSKELAEAIMKIYYEHLNCNQNYYRKYSAVNLIMSLLLENIPLVDSHGESENDLINRILAYVQQSYRENITLESIAHELGYARGHLSRVFHKYVNEGFPTYVNRLRMEEVEKRLDSGENITNLIYEAGFQSPQTYYRTKNKLCKM